MMDTTQWPVMVEREGLTAHVLNLIVLDGWWHWMVYLPSGERVWWCVTECQVA